MFVTLVLTIVASSWTRVELQAMRYMPWIAMAEGRPLGPNGYALDYTAMLSPMAIIHSVKCRHGLVSLVAISSLLLKGMIVLAPGLFRLTTIEFPTPVAIQLSDTFVDRFASSGRYSDSSPFYIRKAVRDFNMSFPFGATETTAYQKFRPADRALGSRGTPGAPLRVVVDGFTAEVECRKLESYRADIALETDTASGNPKYKVGISINFERCDNAYALPLDVHWSGTSKSSDLNSTSWINVPDVTAATGCSSLPPAQPQFVFFAGVFESSPQNASVPVLAKAAAVICAPRPQVVKVEVTDDGFNTTVRRLPDQEPRLFSSDYTMLLRGSVPTGLGEWNNGTNVVTGPITLGMDFSRRPIDNDDPSLYQSEVLYEAVLGGFGRLGGLIGHFSLREEGGPEVTGTRLVRTERLVVDQRAAFYIAAVAAALAGLMLWSFFGIAPKAGISPRDPATLLGNMLFLKDNPAFLDLKTPAESKLTPKEREAADWASTTYSGLLVTTWFRCILFVLLVGVIGGLVFLLRKSQASNGIATIEDDEYLHLLWTSLPTLIMVIVSISIVSANGAVRNLAIYSALSTRSVTSRELDVALIDMYGPRVWYHSIRMKAFIVTLSEALAVLAGFLTIIVSTVFVVNHVPESRTVNLAQESWFGARDFGNIDGAQDTRSTLGGLVLRSGISNFTYPPNTYNNLVFPVLAALPPEFTIGGNITTEAKLPAIRLESKCTPLLESDYSVGVVSYMEGNDTFYEATVKQHIKCPGEDTIKDSSSSFFLSLDPTNVPKVSHVAGRLASPENPFEFNGICLLPTPDDRIRDALEYSSWRVVTYFWGRSTLAEERFSFHAAHRCNYSWVAVDTAVELFGPDRRFDRNFPPIPDEATKRTPNPLFPIPHIDVSSTRYTQQVGEIFPQTNLLNHSSIAAVRPGFLHLLQPYGPFDPSAFGDPAAVDGILAHVTGDYAFLAAQIASVENRLHLDEPSFREPRAPPAAATAPLAVTVVDGARRRLVQNAAPTWALVGILAFAAAVNGWALLSTALRRRGLRGRWLLNMDLKGLAPAGVGSVAVVARLLAASNVFARMPGRRPALWLPVEEMHRVFASEGFRMGWFRRPGGQGMVYTVGFIEKDGSMDFLGSKGDVAAKEAPAKRYPGERRGDEDRVPLRASEYPVFHGR